MDGFRGLLEERARALIPGDPRKGKASSGEDEERQDKRQVWKQLGRGWLPVCKGESRLLFILFFS